MHLPQLQYDVERDNFYELLLKIYCVHNGNKINSNSQVGNNNCHDEFVVGQYGPGKRSKRGWKLIRFCEELNLKIINNQFKKREGKLCIRVSPN